MTAGRPRHGHPDDRDDAPARPPAPASPHGPVPPRPGPTPGPVASGPPMGGQPGFGPPTYVQPPFGPPAQPGPAARGRRRSGPDRAAPEQRARLRRRRWTPGQLPLRLDLAPAGVALGVESDGTPATFPLLVPTHSTRVGILAEAGLARLVALRLLGQSCDLTVVTHRFDTWQRLSAGVPETPFAISQQLRRWPLEGTPPPWALLIDMDDPPPAGFTRVPWSTVVHLAPSLPSASGWWQSAHLVLTTRAHVRSVAALRPRADLSALDRIADDDIVAVQQGGVSVFRSALSQREYQLLNAVDEVAARR